MFDFGKAEGDTASCVYRYNFEISYAIVVAAEHSLVGGVEFADHSGLEVNVFDFGRADQVEGVRVFTWAVGGHLFRWRGMVGSYSCARLLRL